MNLDFVYLVQNLPNRFEQNEYLSVCVCIRFHFMCYRSSLNYFGNLKFDILLKLNWPTDTILLLLVLRSNPSRSVCLLIQNFLCRWTRFTNHNFKASIRRLAISSRFLLMSNSDEYLVDCQLGVSALQSVTPCRIVIFHNGREFRHNSICNSSSNVNRALLIVHNKWQPKW